MKRLSRYRYRLAAIAGTGFVWRVVFVLVWGRSTLVFGDGLFYHEQALTIANGYGYIEPIRFGYLRGAVASAVHPPLFSTVLGGATRLAQAIGITAADGVRFHQLCCAVISTCAVVAVACAARRIAGDRAGLFAALIGCALPAFWANDAVVMSESLVALVVALVILQVLRYRDHRSFANIVLLGVACGAAALTRSELLLFAPVLGVPLMLRDPLPDRSSWQRATRRVVLLGATVALVLMPWVIRNERAFAKSVALSTNIGSMIAGANCAQTYSGPLLGSWTIGCQGVEPQGDESVASKAFLERGLDYARAHKSRIPIVALARVGRTFEVFRPLDDRNDDGRSPWVEWVNVGSFFPLQVLAIFGIVKLRRARMAVWPFVEIFGIVLFASMLGYGVTRFRVPWDVAAVILGGTVFGTAMAANDG